MGGADKGLVPDSHGRGASGQCIYVGNDKRVDFVISDRSWRKVMATREKIEKNLRVLYDEVFNNGRSDLLSSVISGPYIQHNPLFPNGPEPLLAYLKEAGRIPCQVKRMAIDGDLAFVHVRYLDWGGKEQAAVDIFRCDKSGKFLEHWDVLQPVPESAANSNTMF